MKKKSKKIRKRKIKKFVKENIKYIITTSISVIAIIVSIVSLSDDITTNKKNIYPNIFLQSVDNTFVAQKFNDYYQVLYNEGKVNNNMKIVNIGNGIAKNLKFTWDDENSEKLESLIKIIDKNNLVKITEEYQFKKIEMPHLYGVANVSEKNYTKKIDYLLSEKDNISKQNLSIPHDYMTYFKIICFLSLQNGYDINKIMDEIVLYINLEYKNIENESYEKTIPVKISFSKEQYKHKYYYYFNISAEQ